MSVRPSIGPSVRNPFLINRGNEDFKTIKHQETHRIAFLVEIQENSRKFKKIQENSAKFKKIQENSAIYWTQLYPSHVLKMSL